ncbi:unnamed protein product [Heligmosomoides polygyrus]|uniref:Secreted protein n=1 Tax=Heligmosomoides polygyrus TaxID=6339 RepID=A0A183GUJ9_HELPZ|nr:unnamed protein product [Heligmosomoides polygyrus]
MRFSWILLALWTIAAICMGNSVAATAVESSDNSIVERLKRSPVGNRDKRQSTKHRPRPPYGGVGRPPYGGGGRPPYGGGGRPPYGGVGRPPYGGGGRPPFGGGWGRPPMGGVWPPYYG